MGLRWDMIRAGLSSKARYAQRVSDFFSRRWSAPPERNTLEWLDTYGKNPRLAPVSKIAQDLASVPGKLYAVSKRGERKELLHHPFLEFWEQPNPLNEFTPAAVWRLMEIWLRVKGEAAAVIERDKRGFPVELWPIPPHWIVDMPRRGAAYYTIRNGAGERFDLPVPDLYLQREPNPADPYRRGLGQAEGVADEVETDEYMSKYAKAYFYNDATPPTLITAPGATGEELKRLDASWNKRHRGVGNAHKIGILPRGDVTVHKLAQTQKEMDFVASRGAVRDMVNSHFGIPPEMLGIVENSNRATSQAAKQIYAENVLKPILLARQDAVNRQLVSQFGDNLLWEYDEIIPNDEEYQLKKASEGLSRSALLVNEWREEMGYDPLPGWDVMLLPYSVIPTQDAELLTPIAPQTGAQEQPAANPPQEDAPGAVPALEPSAQKQQLAEVSLNGAQVSSLLQIVEAVRSGTLERQSGIALITSAFPFDAAKAGEILGWTDPAGGEAALAGQKSSPHIRRAAVQQQLASERRAQERKARQVVQQYFDSELQQIVKALAQDQKDAAPSWWREMLALDASAMDSSALTEKIIPMLGGVVDWDGQQNKLLGSLQPIWQHAFDAGAATAQKAYALRGIKQPIWTRQLLEHGAQRVGGIMDTTKRELARALAGALADGAGREGMIAAVKTAMPKIQSGRAGVIAQAEVHTSIMSGNFEVLKNGGFTKKTWMTAGDEDVRPSHKAIDGVTIGINERFANGLLYPGDPAGSAQDNVGCRCDIVGEI